MSAVKDLVGPAVDRLAGDLEKLSRQIHDNPELGYQEIKAAAWLTEFLAKQGFKVERGGAGVETAVRGTIETGEGPTIAILCEYDALLGIVRTGFEFSGTAAHASADPWEGVNALDAVIQTFNNVSMLRQQIRPESRIHGIVTSGGAAANIIPEFASAIFYVRAAALDYMWALQKRVIACAEGAAKATGCTLKVIAQPDNVYEPMKRNTTQLDLFRANARTFGVVESPESRERMGSSDVGNV